MIFVELDKAGAEWVIVAYLSGDANMIDVVLSGESPHDRTGRLISNATSAVINAENKLVGNNTNPELITEIRAKHFAVDYSEPNEIYWPRSSSIRQAAKKCNHGLNYGMMYKRFSLENELQENEGKELVELYHSAYPAIRNWHKTIQGQLRRDRTLINCFDRKRKFLGPWGNDLFDAAYSFIPQSTTWDIIREGIHKTYCDDSDGFKPLELMLEVHDSFGFQYPLNRKEDLPEVMIKIGLDYLNPILEYGAKEFRIGTTAKVGLDLGNMIEVTLDNNPEVVQNSLEQAIKRLDNAAEAT